MHVLILVLHRPTQPTGVCRHAVNLAQCLAETDLVSRITLIIGQWQYEYFEQLFKLASSKIRLVTVDIKNSAFSRNRWFIFGLPKLTQQIQPNIIHLSFPFPFVRQWFNAPVIATIHDLYPFECPENFGYPQVWFNQLFLQQCIRNGDGLACVSKCTLESLQTYFPHVKSVKKATVIYNVVEFDDTTPSKFPTQFGQEFTHPFLISVAQHRKNKNLDLLIQAYSALLQAGRLEPQMQLLLVGSPGPETKHLTQLVQTLNIEKQVVFLSGIKDSELRWLYEQAELFIIASSTEGFCLPLVEALTLSCPVVCSDIPIFREVGALQCQYFALEQQALQNLMESILYKLTHASPLKKSEREESTDIRFSKKEISRQLLAFYGLFQ